MLKEYAQATVFFDESDPSNKGGAYAAITVDGDHESGPLDDCEDATEAVFQAACLHDLASDAEEIDAWKFHQEEGGFWRWRTK